MKLANLFRKNNHGTAIIEFAIVAPALMILLAGFTELGIIMFINSDLEAATTMGARIGITGYNGGSGTREAYITSQIISFTGGFLPATQITVNITSYTDFTQIGIPGEGTANDAGGPSAIVLYQTTYNFPIVIPFIGAMLGTKTGNGYVFPIQATAAVRNEPFS